MNHINRGNKGADWFEFSDGKKYYLKSTWELKYAKYLEFLKKQKKIKDWTYEEDVFWFEKIKRGVRSYKPDFKIYNLDGTFEYVEVKGYWDAKSLTKLKRMRIYYPQIKISKVDGDFFKRMNKHFKNFIW